MSNNNETIKTIENLWNNNDAMLIGFGDGYSEIIDRDQAVDEDGKPIFDSYAFIIGNGYDEDIRMWKFSADDIEAFARTW